MRKIPTVFKRVASSYSEDAQRRYNSRVVHDEVNPNAEWVLAGEGVATKKWDGACCMLRDGKLFKRLELKPGKTPPSDFEPMQEPDEATGVIPGWVPVGSGPEDQWFRRAFEQFKEYDTSIPDGTYEAVGPHFGGGNHDKNPEHLACDTLIRHGELRGGVFGEQPGGAPADLQSCPRTFEGLRNWLPAHDIEGIVFHHPDGRMAKIKVRDFGLTRSATANRTAS